VHLDFEHPARDSHRLGIINSFSESGNLPTVRSNRHASIFRRMAGRVLSAVIAAP
jgi:hypothetical protein